MGGLANGSSRSHVPQAEGSHIGDNRLSTSCGVVQRPDHHSGDDLVQQPNGVLIWNVGAVNISFLPLNKAVASGAVFVIASGSDGRTDTRAETL